MKWIERLVELLIELIARQQRDPYALWPAFIAFIIAFGLAIFPAFLISNLPAQGSMRDGMIDILQIFWVASALVGLIILAKGVMLTLARLEKAGRIPD